MRVIPLLDKIKNNIFSEKPIFDKRKNEYYGSVYRFYGIIGTVLLVCAGVFVLMSVVLGYQELTYENIYYFAKDFDMVIKSDNYSAVTVNYGPGDNRSYCDYRGGIVAAEKYSVSVYSATGRETAIFANQYTNPAVSTSSKYILIYDADGTSFSVCNSFVVLHSENIEDRIYYADINDRGEVLIHADVTGYGSALYLYNSSFERTAAYYFNDYIVCSDLSDDGKYIVVSTVSLENGSYAGQLKFYRRGEKEAFQTYDINGELPFACGQFDSDKYYLVTDRWIRLLDIECNVIKEYFILDNQGLIDFSQSEKGLAFSIKENDSYFLTYIPLRGETITLKLNSYPSALNLGDDIIYVLYGDVVAKYDIVSGTYRLLDCAPGISNILITQGDRVFLCYPSYAVCADF